ncbi:flagellar assembly protein FliH [Marinobacter sp.]|uniref:flagellar assembly protein FliH n=1 Tax=Marinobacter sp. TaxID=50741 RepID=UPI00385011BC
MKDRRHLDRIPSEELTAYEKWELPLLDQQGNEVAREEERDVKPLTAADIEEIRQTAWDDGHGEGREAGQAEGREEGRSQGHQEGLEAGLKEGRETGHTEALEATKAGVDTGLERLEAVMAELLDPIRRHEDELESALFNLATVLARAVVFRELKMDSSHIQAVVRQAMASLPSTRENVKVRVNPADAEWVREVAGRFEAETAVVEDDDILEGGCKVETRHSLVDFTVEKRFQKAVQGMLDQQLASGGAGESAELDSMMGDLTDFHRDVLSAPGSAPQTPVDGDSEQEGKDIDQPPR